MQADFELVKEVQDGNKKSFSELVRRHQRGLFRLVVRFLRSEEQAEDVVQESFIKAYKKLDTFEGRSSFKSWLFQIAVNTAKNRLRAVRREDVNIQDINLAVQAEMEADLIHLDVKKVVEMEVAILPKRQRLALQLRIFEDLSFREIAEIMDCPYDTAKANYRHALLKLRDRMKENGVIESWKLLDQSRQIELYRMATEVEH